jgi:excisionase family DNA binding protein
MKHRIIPALLTIGEACEFLGIGRSKLYTMIRDGEFRIIKIGNRKSMLSSTRLKEWVDRKVEQSESVPFQ